MNRKVSLAIVIKNIDGGTGTFLKQILGIGRPIQKISIIALEEPSFHIFNIPNVMYCRSKKNKKEPKGRISAGLILLKEFIFLSRHLRSIDPDVIIAIDTHCNILVCLVKLFIHIRSKLILTFHNSISGVFAHKHYLFSPWLIRVFGRLFFRLSSSMIGVSRGVTEDVVKNFHLPWLVHTIYYGLNSITPHNVSHYSVLKNERHMFPKNVPVVVTISRLAGQKDVDTLIRASIYLFSRSVNHRLLIIGDGKQKEEFKKMIRQSHLANRIFLLRVEKECLSIFSQIRHICVIYSLRGVSICSFGGYEGWITNCRNGHIVWSNRAIG